MSPPAAGRARAASTYLEQDVRAADPLTLVVHALELAVGHTARARGALGSGDLAQKGLAVNRLCSCLGLLQSCLDMERGGEVARNLDRLYAYLLKRVGEAHRRNDAAALAEVARHLEELAATWRVAAGRRTARPEPAGAGAR
jgi:flagellar protein FliS